MRFLRLIMVVSIVVSSAAIGIIYSSESDKDSSQLVEGGDATTNVEPQAEVPIENSEQQSVETPQQEQTDNPDAQVDQVAPAVQEEVSVAAEPETQAVVTPSEQQPVVPVQEKQPLADKEIAHVMPETPSTTSDGAKAPEKSSDAAYTGDDESSGGIDTMSLEEPSGNWFYKRYWYEKAQTRYNRIKERVNQVQDMRAPFFSKRAEADQTIFEPLNANVNLGLGSLSVIISYLMSEMMLLREKEGILTTQEREFLDVLTAQQKELEQLHLDVEAIGKIDNAIDDALERLMEQINVSRTYEKDAWRNFRQIAKELSDKRARELYYGIETYDKNIGDIIKYIQTDFTNYFDQLLKTAREQSQRIQSVVSALKEKGIDFQKHAEKIEKDAQARDNERIEKEKVAAVEEAVEKTRAELSWYSPLITAWDYTVSALGSGLGYVSSATQTVWAYLRDGAQEIYATIAGWFGTSDREPDAEQISQTAVVPPMPQPPQPQEAPASVMPVSQENAAAAESKELQGNAPASIQSVTMPELSQPSTNGL